MKHRSFAIGVTAVLLALSFLAAGCAGKTASAAGLQDRGLAMVAQMQALASSDAYVNAMSSSAELGERIAAMAAGDYAAPTAVYAVSVPAGTLRALLFGGESADLSDALITWTEAKAYAAIPTQIAGRAGATELAAVSCVTYTQALLCKELAAPALYLYQYNGAYSAMAAFIPGLDGACNATTCFIPNDDALRAADSAQAVAEWLSGTLGYMEATAEKIA